MKENQEQDSEQLNDNQTKAKQTQKSKSSKKTSRAGRPRKLNRRVLELICKRVAQGQSLRKICADPDMPDRATIWRWKREDPDFAQAFALARQDQAENFFEEVIELADQCASDSNALRKAKLQIDSRKWILLRMLPPMSFSMGGSENETYGESYDDPEPDFLG